MLSFWKKKSQSHSDLPALTAVTETPYRKLAVYVCDKCGKKLAKSKDEGSLSVSFQKSMKKDAIAQFGAKEVRVMISSCQDVCPEGKIAVAVVPADGRGKPDFFVAEPTELEAAKKSLFEIIRKKLN